MEIFGVVMPHLYVKDLIVWKCRVEHFALFYGFFFLYNNVNDFSFNDRHRGVRFLSIDELVNRIIDLLFGARHTIGCTFIQENFTEIFCL